ncbi:MAG TPA: peptidylprolyl isomerase [Chryseosolibacter sp.]|nr:peptidylprolyl isomerase [Chryseosolibacter sp.]
MKHCSFLLFVLLLAVSCGQKKPVTEVNPQNVREELTRYGELNPEKEVLIETEFGNMVIRLYDETPLHRANFIKNIKEGVYDEAVFYRIIFQFMIQGGIHPKELRYNVPAELNKNLIHKTGALSMARGDENNPELESSSTEFFIVHGSTYKDYQVDEEAENNSLSLTPEQKEIYMTSGGYMSLDQRYTTFGEVTEGLDVIEKIASVKIFDEDKPLKNIPFKISLRQ